MLFSLLLVLAAVLLLIGGTQFVQSRPTRQPEFNLRAVVPRYASRGYLLSFPTLPYP